MYRAPTYYVSGTVLGMGDRTVNEIEPGSCKAHLPVGEDR